MKNALLTILLLLSGASLAAAETETAAQCLENLKKDARFSTIASRVALDGQRTATQSMLDDQSIPNEAQKHAIADWIDARGECVNRNPVKIYVDLHLLFLTIVPSLYNEQLSFGEFNQKWHTLFDAAMEASKKPYEPATHHHH